MTPSLRTLATLALGLASTAHVWAAQAGWREISVPAVAANAASATVALYYPTRAPERAIPMGPFTPRVAYRAEPDAQTKGLIVLSHGTGGSELGHTSLAEALARSGYLVAALRHPGDNWQDRSLPEKESARYFSERPRQVSRLIDALLRDPDWKDRIPSDAQGPRIGAVGHSAGGYTVLALAGGQPEPARIAAHCKTNATQDPIFCGMGARQNPATTGAGPDDATLRDPRIRAVVALAPVGVVFSPASLAQVKPSVLLYDASEDRWLVQRFHADWVARHLPGIERRTVPGAWHFAFMDKPGMPIPTDDGDIAADPPGFDRPALLGRLALELPAFFDRTLR